MFLSLPRNVFNKKNSDEINTAFQFIDSKISKQKRQVLKSKIKSNELDIDGVEFNVSKKIGNYFAILVYADKPFQLSNPPFIEINTYGVNEEGEFVPVKVATDGSVSFEPLEGKKIWIKLDYVLAKD